MVFLTLGHAKVAVLKREKLIVIAGPFNRMVHIKMETGTQKVGQKNHLI